MITKASIHAIAEMLIHCVGTWQTAAADMHAATHRPIRMNIIRLHMQTSKIIRHRPITKTPPARRMLHNAAH